ncbi:TerB family tellurite resistance protein [Sediminitomix flava]|uniref:Tellurite resistance protein TerB n=1 Tax=Sediminitomix flava TaxID=379075 RepID=A0A315ZH83_SEDFL|nr:TerB family tellurite resistance protein [Sediminitomix flava]PWJ44543.1 tellurite resistance protein TerB [Sediminitomix flava]
MVDKEKLYETLGELLYVVAMADGVIQKEEKEALNKLFENHTWASEIIWSFEYEEAKHSSVEEVYNKVINVCHAHGPAAEYTEFVSAMKIIADAADGIDENEQKVIRSFSTDLIERFQRDLDRFN